MSYQSAESILEFCRELEAERRVSCQALHYWTGLQGSRSMPRLEDVDFGNLPEFGDNLFVMTAGNGGAKFVLKNCGQVITGICCEDPNGVDLLEAFPIPLNESAQECCSSAIIARQPMIDAGTVVGEDRSFIYRMIMMPLGEEGAKVDHVLGAFSFREVE